MQPPIIAAIDKAIDVITENGLDGHAAALRWTAYHSALKKEHGDAIVVGCSSVKQLEANLDALEAGPLPEKVVAALEAVYGEVGPVVPYHY